MQRRTFCTYSKRVKKIWWDLAKVLYIDQIVMLAQQLLDPTCKWKDEHDKQVEEIKKTGELTNRLRRAEETLKKTRVERDTNHFMTFICWDKRPTLTPSCICPV